MLFLVTMVKATTKRTGRITLSRIELFLKFLKVIRSLPKHLSQDDSALKVIQFVELPKVV